MKLLHFTSDTKEYIVLTDDDESTWLDNARPGFKLSGTADVENDNGRLPTETPLDAL